MTWNYRVVKTVSDGDESYGIHEVYYDDFGNPTMYSSDPCPLYSETIEGLRKEILRFSRALEIPVLNEDDFKHDVM